MRRNPFVVVCPSCAYPVPKKIHFDHWTAENPYFWWWCKLKKSDTNEYPISGGVQHEQEIEWPLLQRVQERGRETGC